MPFAVIWLRVRSTCPRRRSIVEGWKLAPESGKPCRAHSVSDYVRLSRLLELVSRTRDSVFCPRAFEAGTESASDFPLSVERVYPASNRLPLPGATFIWCAAQQSLVLT